MTKRIIILHLFLLFSTTILAQNTPIFTVVSGLGNNTTGKTILKTGDKIADKDAVIRVESYLALLHKTAGTVEITEAGNYTIADLEGKLIANKSASKIANDLVNSAVVLNPRGLTAQRDISTSFVMGLPATSALFDAPILLSWQINQTVEAGQKAQLSTVKDFVVIVKNLAGKELVRKEVSGTKIELNITQSPLNETFLNCQVMAKSNSNWASNWYGLKRLDTKNSTRVATTYNELSTNKTAIGKIILARFFEQEGLFANAAHAYEEALKIANTPEYQQFYGDFTRRIIGDSIK